MARFIRNVSFIGRSLFLYEGFRRGILGTSTQICNVSTKVTVLCRCGACSLSLSQAVLMFINQVRSKLSTFGGFGGPNEVTCGGNALKLYASVLLNIRRTGLVKKGEEMLRSQLQVKVVKNKLAAPFRIGQFELKFGKGICKESEIINLGLKYKFMSKAGAFYSFNSRSFHGKDALKTFISVNEDAREELNYMMPR